MSSIPFEKREILKYVGDLSQLFGVKSYTLDGGRAEGVRAVDVKNGSGLEFTVLPGRCLDLSCLSYKGVNCSYISKTGIVSSQYYNEKGAGFLRSFFAGFLTTSGLTNVGSPCEDTDEELGLHGRISNTPAYDISAGTEWVEGLPLMKVSGKARQAAVFGENIELRREISCKYGENKVYINDTVENYGFKDEPLMLLYHFNLGYPLLSEKSYLISSSKVEPRNGEAAKGLNNYSTFQPPTKDYSEQVFYHEPKTQVDGKTCVALINPELRLGAAIWFNKNQLCRLTQWKQAGEGEYVMGIEPCNCHVDGRAEERKRGTLEFLKPGEIREFNLEVEILDGEHDIRRMNDIINSFR
jgi:hypothetical protein